MADIKNMFSKGLTTLNVKTANFLEINKIKTYISTLKGEIEALKLELGAALYENWKAGDAPATAEMEEKLRLIQEKEELIAAQEAEAERLAEMEKQILGEADKPAAPAASEPAGDPVLVCPNCGQVYDRVFKFCRKCGTRMNQ